MKRFIAVQLALLLIISMVACGNKTEENSSSTESLQTQSSSETNATGIDSTNQTVADASANGTGDDNDMDGGNLSGTGIVTGRTALATPSTAGRLKVSGTRLVGQNGQLVQLRGISTHGLAWFPEYVNNQAFSEFRNNWGANVIRLAMYTAESGGYCTGGNKSQLLQTIYNGVEYATRNDMYVVIDWHVLNDNDPNRYKTEAMDFWTNISKKYAGYNNVIYEICNEPCGGTSWESIKAYANEIIPAIRTNDPNAIIVVGTPNWSQEVDKAAASPITGYDNIMYTLHFYAATHKGDLQNKMTSAISAGLPIMVTEFGICDASGNGALDIASANQWVDLMNANGVSYICWNLSNKNESSALIKPGCSKTNGFAVSDLSDEGKWLYELLSNAAANGISTIPKTSTNNVTGSNPQNNTSSNNNTSNNNTSNGNTNNNTSANNAAAKVGIIGETKTISSGAFQIKMKLENGWVSGNTANRQYVCTITNSTSSDASKWSVTIDLDTKVSLINSWNGNFKVEGNRVTISNLDYNGSIKAGQSINDIGFIVALQ